MTTRQEREAAQRLRGQESCRVRARLPVRELEGGLLAERAERGRVHARARCASASR